MKHFERIPPGETRGALIATLGSDFQRAVEPFKQEIVELAGVMQGDQQRAAMRLLIDHGGRRPNAIEQQLIIAALAELQDRTVLRSSPAGILSGARIAGLKPSPALAGVAGASGS